MLAIFVAHAVPTYRTVDRLNLTNRPRFFPNEASLSRFECRFEDCFAAIRWSYNPFRGSLPADDVLKEVFHFERASIN
jgi:hypothetical protein